MSMANRDGFIWYDGRLVPWRDATTHVLTHTLHYGLGVFEGVRCYETAAGPSIFRLRDHTDRLFRSAQIFGMKQMTRRIAKRDVCGHDVRFGENSLERDEVRQIFCALARRIASSVAAAART